MSCLKISFFVARPCNQGRNSSKAREVGLMTGRERIVNLLKKVVELGEVAKVVEATINGGFNYFNYLNYFSYLIF
jgi:hypothetical protein